MADPAMAEGQLLTVTQAWGWVSLERQPGFRNCTEALWAVPAGPAFHPGLVLVLDSDSHRDYPP